MEVILSQQSSSAFRRIDVAPETLELARAAIDLAGLPVFCPGNRLYNLAFAAVYRFLSSAEAAESAGATPEELSAVTATARAFAGRHSVTIAHAQTWPRGYPGDFQIVERMLDGVPDGAAGSVQYAIDRCMLQLPIVAQHRAKVLWQAGLVRRGLLAGARRVLSIACGGSRDLMLLEAPELAPLELTLTDSDDAALELSAQRLSGRVRSLRRIQGNVLRAANRLRAAGPFDVILVGGLLDYLPRRAAVTLLRQAVTMLAPGGVIGATNIGAPNPFRLWLELIADWPLIERDRRAMEDLARACGAGAELELDATGLTHLMTLRVARP